MDFDAGIPMSRGPFAVTSDPPSLSPSLNKHAMWQMNLRSSEGMESGPYPERPCEPDCSYYIRTSLCRFGATCLFNHPPNRKLGEPLCSLYSQHGMCKFGSSCKFDHPMGIFTYNVTTSSSADAPVRRLLGSSSGSAALSSESLVEGDSTKPRRHSRSEPRQMSPSEDNIDTEE